MTIESRFSISEISTVAASFAEDLDAFREAGAAGIGIWEFKLADDEAALKRFAESGLVATHCVPAVPSILPLPELEGPEEPEVRVEAICSGIQRLAAFEPEAILCLTGPRGERSEEDARATVVEGLRRIADEASKAGVRMSVEPIQERFAESWTLISTIPATLDLLEEVGKPELGVFFDTWHLWNTEGLLEQIERHASRFAGVHVADWREPTRMNADRVLPGDGVARLPAILGALERAGYRGWYDVEIFSDTGLEDSLWALPPRELAARARRSFLRVWAARTSVGEPMVPPRAPSFEA